MNTSPGVDLDLWLLLPHLFLPVLAGRAAPCPRLLCGGPSAAAGLFAHLWAMLDLLHAEAAWCGSQLALDPGLIRRRADAHAALIAPCWDGRSDA